MNTDALMIPRIRAHFISLRRDKSRGRRHTHEMIDRIAVKVQESAEVTVPDSLYVHEDRVAQWNGSPRPEDDRLNDSRKDTNEVHELNKHVSAHKSRRHEVLTGYQVIYLATSTESFSACCFSAKPASTMDSAERGLIT